MNEQFNNHRVGQYPNPRLGKSCESLDSEQRSMNQESTVFRHGECQTYTVKVNQSKKGRMNVIAESIEDAIDKAKVIYDSNKDVVHWMDDDVDFDATLFRFSNDYDEVKDKKFEMPKEKENELNSLNDLIKEMFNSKDETVHVRDKTGRWVSATALDTNWRPEFNRKLKEDLEKYLSETIEDDSVVGEEDCDEVNHPFHYTDGGIECIDAMELLFGKKAVMIFCKLNAFKYLWRCGKKGDAETDINKAKWYMNHKNKLKESL